MRSHRPICIDLLIAVLAIASLPCAAQNPNEVHVQPRSKPEAPKTPDPSLKTHTKPIVSNVDVVLVPVTVIDPLTRIVTGLERQNFRIFEDGKPQEIEYFYSQDAPISVGVIFDNSGSMDRAINTSREAVIEFMKTSNPEDEFFLITFADKPVMMGDFTDKPEEIQGKLLYTMPRGLTALWDAVYLGISKMRSAKYPKRALLVISDGGENHSRYTDREMRRVVRESDVQIYGIAIPGADYGPWGMAGISDATGGRTFVGPPDTFADTAAKIAIELRNQYVLGYRPKEFVHNGKFRKIRVKLQPPRGLPPLNISAKKAATMRRKSEGPQRTGTG
jgi:Ca-activated chloride channel homolog